MRSFDLVDGICYCSNTRIKKNVGNIPGQETIDETFNRLKEAICLIAESHPDQKVALFTHGGCIKIFIANFSIWKVSKKFLLLMAVFMSLSMSSESHLFLKNF